MVHQCWFGVERISDVQANPFGLQQQRTAHTHLHIAPILAGVPLAKHCSTTARFRYWCITRDRESEFLHTLFGATVANLPRCAYA